MTNTYEQNSNAESGENSKSQHGMGNQKRSLDLSKRLAGYFSSKDSVTETESYQLTMEELYDVRRVKEVFDKCLQDREKYKKCLLNNVINVGVESFLSAGLNRWVKMFSSSSHIEVSEDLQLMIISRGMSVAEYKELYDHLATKVGRSLGRVVKR